MLYVIACDVEVVGFGELGGVTVSRPDDERQLLSRLHCLAAEGHVLGDDSRRGLHGAVVSQQLLGGVLDALQLAAQQVELIGMLQQREQAVADEIGGGLVPRDEEQLAGLVQLVGREPIPSSSAAIIALREVLAGSRLRSAATFTKYARSSRCARRAMRLSSSVLTPMPRIASSDQCLNFAWSSAGMPSISAMMMTGSGAARDAITSMPP